MEREAYEKLAKEKGESLQTVKEVKADVELDDEDEGSFDFDAMKANPDQIIINEDKGLGGRVDREEHSYYEITPKKNSSLSFTTFYLDKEGGFGTWSDYNYVYIFEK